MTVVREIIPQRLWTAFWAAIAATGACFIFGRLNAVFYTYLLFDLFFSLFYLPALVIAHRIENWSFFALTTVWLLAGWFLAPLATEIVF